MTSFMVQSRRACAAILVLLLAVLVCFTLAPLSRAQAQVDLSHYHYDVDASVHGGHGSVNPRHQEVHRHHTASISIYPGTGYRIKGIYDNLRPKPIQNLYVIEDVERDHQVIVVFARDTDVAPVLLTP
jgi:hypothetical protein